MNDKDDLHEIYIKNEKGELVLNPRLKQRVRVVKKLGIPVIVMEEKDSINEEAK